MEIHEVAKSLKEILPILQDEIEGKNGHYEEIDADGSGYIIYGLRGFKVSMINLYDDDRYIDLKRSIVHRGNSNDLRYRRHSDADDAQGVKTLGSISLGLLSELEDGRDNTELVLTYGRGILFLIDETFVKMIKFTASILEEIKKGVIK